MNNFSDTVKTLDKVIAVRTVVEDLASLEYKTGGSENIKEKLEKDLSQELVDLILSRLESTKDKESEVKKMQEELEAFKVVRLKMAFEPSEVFLEEVADILRNKFGDSYVVDVEVDRGIMAGVILEIEGQYRDLSLRKMFEDKYGQL